MSDNQLTAEQEKILGEEVDKVFDFEAVRKGMDAIIDGGTMKELKGLTTEDCEAIYSVGLNAYKVGSYEDADTVFRYLVLLDHLCPKYWIALGAVQQMRRDFQKAVSSYGYASFLDLENPKPQYHAAECFLALGDKENAKSALAALDMYAPKDSPYREKAKKLSERL